MVHAHTLYFSSPPQPPYLQPSVNATQPSVHAISQADRLEVVAVFCLDCLLHKSIQVPSVKHDFLAH